MVHTGRTSMKTRDLVLLAMLTAITLLMAFTPIGYLKVGPLSISFLTIPVAVGAIMLGVRGGAIIGGIFGLTSFIQCFGLDPFGAMLLGIQPIFAFILCFVTRLVMGILVALIFKGMTLLFKKDNIISYYVASVSAALLNTVLFVGTLILLYGTNADVLAAFEVDSVIGIIIALVTFNAAIEAGATLVIGTAISKVLMHVIRRREV